MHANVEKRLAAIEQKTAPEKMTITRRFVRPGANGPVECKPVAITAGDWRIDREEGEPLEAFRERAWLEAPPNKHGVRCLMDVLAD